MAILGGNAHFFGFSKAPVWLFHFVSERFTSKQCFLVQQYLFFPVNCFCLHETSVVCHNYKIYMQSCPDGASSSICTCSKGSTLQCILILLKLIIQLHCISQILWQVDSILFSLLVLRALCDSRGRVWRCHPSHMYAIEATVPKV